MTDDKAGDGVPGRREPSSYFDHVRPDRTVESVGEYRRSFRPSRWTERPHVMVSVLTICAEDDDRAQFLARRAYRYFAKPVAGGGDIVPFSSVAEMTARGLAEAEQAVADMLTATQAIGDHDHALSRLGELQNAVDADETMFMTPVFDIDDRSRSFELLVPTNG
ncbi:MAG TPA: hypothetical protein VJ914_06620 [Pseudonocardiaceae bacterium]|nr:hypothetical protein [Pseudonocardiaceae bacterium]